MLELSIPEAIRYLVNMPISEWIDLFWKLPTYLFALQIFINTVLTPDTAKKFNVLSKVLVFFEQLKLRKRK